MDAIEQLKQDVREGRSGLDRLIDVIGMLQRQLEAARQRIEELEKKSANPTPPAAGSPGKIEQPFSMRAEEKRQRQRGKSDKHKLSRNGRRGRFSTAGGLGAGETWADGSPAPKPVSRASGSEVLRRTWSVRSSGR